MDIVASLVKSPVRVTAIIGQLVTDVLQSFLWIESHAFWGIPLGIDAGEDRPKSLPDRKRADGF
jgi:hypothetical protein